MSSPILIYEPGGGVPVGPVSNPPVYSQAGTTQLVEDQAYIDVVFGSVQTTDEWVLVECVVVNELDVDPLNIWPGIITDKTAAGFRLQLNGMPDSGNYYLHWAVSGVNIAPSPATSYLLTGPSTAQVGVPVTFTVRLPPSTTVPGSVTVTPTDVPIGDSVEGIFEPSSVILSTSQASATFTYTPFSVGSKTISTTNSSTLIDPAGIVLTVSPPAATTYTLTGPSAGGVGVASSNFTVALPGGTTVSGTVTVTPSSGGGGGTFTPTTVGLTTGAPSATFTYTPASDGTKTISTTNNGGLTDPGSLSYVATLFDPSTIAGLNLWLKADTLALTDGANVTAWNDSSGNGNNFTPAATPPIYKTNIVNSKPIVRFSSASSNGLSSTTASIIPTNTTNYTIFVVVSDASVGASSHFIFATGISGPGSAVSLQRYLDGNYHTHYDTGLVQASETSGVPTGTWYVITADWNGSNIHLWRSGILKGTTGTTLMGRAGTESSIGYNRPDGTVGRWDGDMAEILVYNSALSAPDRTNVEAYLTAKYAL